MNNATPATPKQARLLKAFGWTLRPATGRWARAGCVEDTTAAQAITEHRYSWRNSKAMRRGFKLTHEQRHNHELFTAEMDRQNAEYSARHAVDTCIDERVKLAAAKERLTRHCRGISISSDPFQKNFESQIEHAEGRVEAAQIELAAVVMARAIAARLKVEPMFNIFTDAVESYAAAGE